MGNTLSAVSQCGQEAAIDLDSQGEDSKIDMWDLPDLALGVLLKCILLL